MRDINPNHLQCLHKLLSHHKLTVAAAESCTGGLMGAALTELSGSSAYFMGGIIAYANQTKINCLGVDPQILATFGAVSEECACAMVDGLAQHFAANLRIAITGIAGPSGGTKEKPVGTVWVALKYGALQTVTKQLNLTGDRRDIRYATVNYVLEKLSQIVKEQYQ